MEQSSRQRMTRGALEYPRPHHALPFDHMENGREVPRAEEDGYRVHHTTGTATTWEISRPRSLYATYTFVLAPGQFLLLPVWMPDVNSLSVARHLSVWDIPWLAGTCRCALQELCVWWRMSIAIQHAAMPSNRITLGSVLEWALVRQDHKSDTDTCSD